MIVSLLACLKLMTGDSLSLREMYFLNLITTSLISQELVPQAMQIEFMKVREGQLTVDPLEVVRDHATGADNTTALENSDFVTNTGTLDNPDATRAAFCNHRRGEQHGRYYHQRRL